MSVIERIKLGYCKFSQIVNIDILSSCLLSVLVVRSSTNRWLCASVCCECCVVVIVVVDPRNLPLKLKVKVKIS